MITNFKQRIFMGRNAFQIIGICIRNINNLPSSRLPASTESEWIKPNGYDTGVQVYNSLTNATVPLISHSKDLLNWYVCGPTVHDEIHIGQAYSYVQFDIIRRILEKYFHCNVVMAMGIIDVADKVVARSRELNATIQHIAKHYEQEFFTDLGKLHVLPPTIVTRVSQHIPQIIDFCDNIRRKGFAYSTSEGTLYLDLKRFGRFEKLSSTGIKEETNELVANVEQNPRGFALWKAVKPGEPWWESPWGKGQPGYHVQCSTMASCVFGSQLDVYSGVNHLSLHQKTEEKLCEVYHEMQQWANYLLHTGQLQPENDITVADPVKINIPLKSFLKESLANEFRIMCLRVPYRNDTEYSHDTINECRAINKKFKEFLINAESYVHGNLKCSPFDDAHLLKCLSDTKKSVHQCFTNDFDTPQALEKIMELVNEVNKNLQVNTKSNNNARSPGVIAGCCSFVAKILELFGIQYSNKEQFATFNAKVMLSSVLNSVVKLRSTVRLHALTTGTSSQPQYATPIIQDSSETGKSEKSFPELLVEPPEDKGDKIWTDKSLAMKRKVELKRKEKEPLVKACDDIRNDLFIAGVQLKDKGKESSWSMLEDRTLEGKRSSLASHDAFDPCYKPRSS